MSKYIMNFTSFINENYSDENFNNFLKSNNNGWTNETRIELYSLLDKKFPIVIDIENILKDEFFDYKIKSSYTYLNNDYSDIIKNIGGFKNNNSEENSFDVNIQIINGIININIILKSKIRTYHFNPQTSKIQSISKRNVNDYKTITTKKIGSTSINEIVDVINKHKMKTSDIKKV